MSTKATGAAGEELACRALEERGYRVVERNWRTARGEVDVVARDGDCWVFVEVKTRRGRRAENPEEAIPPRKVRRLTDHAYTYLCDHDLANVDWRIDFVAVDLDSANAARSLRVYQALVAE